MLDQDGVGPLGVGLAIGFVRHVDGSKRGAAIERERIEADELGLGDHRMGLPHFLTNHASILVTLLPKDTGGQSELNQATLALEDGTVFEGRSFGAQTDRLGEVVFNTAITGYQEIFTDPSYSGQIVVLTNPQIGNYGANEYDQEAARPHIEGLVVREFSSIASNLHSAENADQLLPEHGIPVAAEIEIRALVRHLRTRRVMRCILSPQRGD